MSQDKQKKMADNEPEIEKQSLPQVNSEASGSASSSSSIIAIQSTSDGVSSPTTAVVSLPTLYSTPIWRSKFSF